MSEAHGTAGAIERSIHKRPVRSHTVTELMEGLNWLPRMFRRCIKLPLTESANLVDIENANILAGILDCAHQRSDHLFNGYQS